MNTPSSFKVGRVLGKCQLLELIGRGGMGSVYVAKHLFLHRMVAVKLLSWTFSDVEERNMEAFETGARALARLNHPNIATIYDIDEENGRPYIVTEFVDGQDVATILRKKGRIKPSTAVAIASSPASFAPDALVASTIEAVKMLPALRCSRRTSWRRWKAP